MREEYPLGGIDRMTDELRTQLQEMTAVSYALGSTLAGNEKAEEYLAVLNRRICNQLRLVRRLEIDWRAKTRDEDRMNVTLVDLAALCRKVMERTDELTRPLLEIRAEFTTSLTALPTLADRGMLEELLLELVSNSVRSIGHSGTVRLKLELEPRKNGDDQAVLTVTDTGRGLDLARLSGLLDPEVAPAEFPGRGLTLVRRIAALHGGTLAACNTEAGGARLVVAIPVREQSGGMLNTPRPDMDAAGGWNPALVALSGLLPLSVFRPRRGEKL